MMQHFDTELFIDAIKNRRSLWNTSCEDYKNRLLVKKQWYEVSAVMCPTFVSLDSKQQEELCRELQRKWRHIRDAFVRYLRSLKSTTGSVRKTGKPYRYARNLQFLKKQITSPPEPSEFAAVPIKSEEDNYEEFDVDETNLPVMIETDNSVEESVIYNSANRESEDLEKVGVCLNPFQLHEAPKTEESSDDMDFFRSLLPMLRTMPMQEKLKFRMDVMKTLLDYLQK